MTNSVFIPNGKQTQDSKKSVYVEHVKNKQTCGDRFVYEHEDFSTNQKSEYVRQSKT